jgi:hypothetical protein
MLGRCDVGLHSLPLGAVLERTLHVKSAIASVRARELTVDEDCTTEIFASGGELVGGDQAIDDSLHGRSLFRSEKVPWSGLGNIGRIGAARQERKPTFDLVPRAQLLI